MALGHPDLPPVRRDRLRDDSEPEADPLLAGGVFRAGQPASTPSIRNFKVQSPSLRRRENERAARIEGDTAEEILAYFRKYEAD